MRRPDRARVGDMLDAIRAAANAVAGKASADLIGDETLVAALAWFVQVAGEAAKHVPPETQALAPEVPWSEVCRARDKITHGYFDLDLGHLWKIVAQDFPALRAPLERLFAALSAPPRS
jgi:uncharacterized protein with HEPN domain